MAEEFKADVTVISHKDEVKKALDSGIVQALEAIGMTAESYAQDIVRTAGFQHPTGNLLGSITHVLYFYWQIRLFV